MNRLHSITSGQLRAGTAEQAESNKKYLEGYFAVFDSVTEIEWGFCEVIRKGAFSKSLSERDICCLFNHQDGKVLGRTKNKTLELKEDEKGLWGRVEINEKDPEALAVYARVARGDIGHCSFGFTYAPGGRKSTYRGVDEVLDELTEVNLIEVSVVTFPAYTATEIGARKQGAHSTARTIDQIKENIRKAREHEQGQHS